MVLTKKEALAVYYLQVNAHTEGIIGIYLHVSTMGRSAENSRKIKKKCSERKRKNMISHDNLHM